MVGIGLIVVIAVARLLLVNSVDVLLLLVTCLICGFGLYGYCCACGFACVSV